MTERIKSWRSRKAGLGGKSLTIMLEPETALVLEKLKQEYGESNARLVARALKCLDQSFTSKPENNSSQFTCKRFDGQKAEPSGSRYYPVEESELLSLDDLHPSLKDIREELCRGATVEGLKEKIKAALKEMKSQGYDSSQIVDLLYEAQIKTIKGLEKWEAGTVRKWWK